MKKPAYFWILILVAWSCSQPKNISKSPDSTPAILQDSTEYEISIIDPEFERWYSIKYSAAVDRNNEYYRTMNVRGVTHWNEYLTRNKFNRVIDSYINYNFAVDYGIDVNRRLYWYFRYIEENFKIPLLK